ncbi:MAG: bifunctional 3-(3-hydroxy-phenyl)propionate/3-hydroxycinnamic acid hydroxylase [Hylemonella sp.]|nr:bifunctional 3-(3-hydroxy-phenyl)propionate/3-hydroxycinnamic acid hydroxylase [Hylemonella sp.]
MRHVDVIIVGMGPTGATLAGLLGQVGVSVAIFDKLPNLYPLPRALGLDHETMRIVQELGIAEQVAPHIADYRPSEYLGMDGQLIKRLDTMPEPHLLGWAPNYVFEQPAFERVLRARLSELPMVQMHCEADVLGTGQTEGDAGVGQVWADVTLAGSTAPVRFTANYLIACDGGSSSIRKRLGIELEDLNFDEPWLVVDAIVPDEKLADLPQTQVQYCEAARPSTFVVGTGNHRRWEVMLLPGDSLSPEYPEEELWPLLSRWIKPGEARLWRAATYRFHGLVAREWRRGRILLAGDAAHMTPPFMAQGMVSGMRDAHNLAWKLTRVIKRESSPALLDTYAEERHPHVTTTILNAMGLGRIICERDPARAIERDKALRAAHGGQVKTEYRQNMIPSLKGGILEKSSMAAGDILAQPFVVAGQFSGRLDDLTGARVRVIAIGELMPQDLEAYTALLAPLGGVLVHLNAKTPSHDAIACTEEKPLLAPWLTSRGLCAVIARPDHYIYGTATTHRDGQQLLVKLRSALDS